jgi:hypothetical protein
MQLWITIRAEESPIMVRDVVQLEDALGSASEQAQTTHLLGAILLEVENGNVMMMVVGSEKTVLGFDYDGQGGLNYATEGRSNEAEPIMTCFLHFQHHTEFPRRYVIPLEDGMRAATQFLDSGELPTLVSWEQV